MPLAIYFYDLVKAVHVAAIVLAFGVTFSYPVLLPWFKANRPEFMPAVHAGQGRVGTYLIIPGAVIALISGAYMANDRDLFGETWVVVPLLILLTLIGLGIVFFTPAERRLGELSERDLAAGGTLSAEYDALFARASAVGALSGALILVAIFFMAAKPFA